MPQVVVLGTLPFLAEAPITAMDRGAKNFLSFLIDRRMEYRPGKDVNRADRGGTRIFIVLDAGGLILDTRLKRD